MPSRIRRIHITGGAGSGKTRLASRLSRALNLPLYDLDGMLLARIHEAPDPADSLSITAALRSEVGEIAATPAWVADGSYVTWSAPLFEASDIVICLDCSWPVASYRITMRHVRAELARNNRFPGWRTFYRFWRWTRAYYSDRNGDGANEWGTPDTRRYHLRMLEGYRHKLCICRGNRDVEALLRRLS